MLYRAKDLSPEKRHAAEVLLGRSVSDDETVSIKSLNFSTIIPSALPTEERIAALRTLDERFAERQMPDVGALLERGHTLVFSNESIAEILNPARVPGTIGKPASNCFTGAFYAIGQAWIP